MFTVGKVVADPAAQGLGVDGVIHDFRLNVGDHVFR